MATAHQPGGLLPAAAGVRLAQLSADHDKVAEYLANLADHTDALLRDLVDHEAERRDRAVRQRQEKPGGSSNVSSSRRTRRSIAGGDDAEEDGSASGDLRRAVDDLLTDYRGVLDMRARVGARKAALDSIRAHVAAGRRADGQPLDDDNQEGGGDGEAAAAAAAAAAEAEAGHFGLGMSEEFARRAEEAKREWARLSERSRYGGDTQFMEAATAAWRLDHDGEFELSGRDADGGGGEDDDDEVAVVETRETLLCPITMKLLEDPHVSRACGHAFSAAIVTLIQRSDTGRIECPVSGCRRMLGMSDLARSRALERKVERARREAQRRARLEEEEDDNDEEAAAAADRDEEETAVRGRRASQYAREVEVKKEKRQRR